MTIPKPIEPDANAGLVDHVPDMILRRLKQWPAADKGHDPLSSGYVTYLIQSSISLIQQLTAERDAAIRGRNAWSEQAEIDFNRAEAAEAERDDLARCLMDCLPKNHTILEQADMLDGRVSQTVRDGVGREYQRIVHSDEVYGGDEDA